MSPLLSSVLGVTRGDYPRGLTFICPTFEARAGGLGWVRREFTRRRAGHEKGGYTGADRMQPGAFEQAHGGTLFLDEVGDLDLELQAKLLRAVESGEIRRIGARQPIVVDTRVICATHKSLSAMVGAGKFREDLYFRLCEMRIELPPLRERQDDTP